jgi:arsenate reductase
MDSGWGTPWIFVEASRARLKGVEFDYVVTVCVHAHQQCPLFPRKAGLIHVGSDDPPTLAPAATTGEERLAPYRRVPDENRTLVKGLPNRLEQ